MDKIKEHWPPNVAKDKGRVAKGVAKGRKIWKMTDAYSAGKKSVERTFWLIRGEELDECGGIGD